MARPAVPKNNVTPRTIIQLKRVRAPERSAGLINAVSSLRNGSGRSGFMWLVILLKKSVRLLALLAEISQGSPPHHATPYN